MTDDLHLEELPTIIRTQAPEAEEVAMTVAQELREEGRAAGMAEMLLKQLALKFYEPSGAERVKVRGASLEQLAAWVAGVLTATSLESLWGE